jgi:hypothetical protein
MQTRYRRRRRVMGARSPDPVGHGPYWPAVDTNGDIWVPNRDSNNLTVINHNTMVGTTIATDSQPQYVLNEGAYMWVSCYSSNKLDEFSTPTRTLVRAVSSPHSGPENMWSDVSSTGIWVVSWSGWVSAVGDSGVIGTQYSEIEARWRMILDRTRSLRAATTPLHRTVR